MGAYKTEQEQFWAGEFGTQYIGRNPENFEFMGRASLFSRIMSRTPNIKSCIEFGANIGNNLKVLQQMIPDVELAAVEINASAVAELEKWGGGARRSISPFSTLFQSTNLTSLLSRAF